jgi:hypothetical protein
MRLGQLLIIILAIGMVASMGVQADDGLAAPKKEASQKASGSDKAAPNLGASKSPDASEKPDAVKTASKIAEIVIPEMSSDRIQEFVEILKPIKGIQAIKPDKKAGVMFVTFAADMNFKKQILPAVKKVFTKAEVRNISEAKNVATGKCGGCPHKAKCDGAKKSETGKEEVKKETKSSSVQSEGCAGKH